MEIQKQESLTSNARDMSGELHCYRQRDLTQSHLYRLGTKLFRSEPTRQRVLEAAYYVPRELVPHTINLRRTWDGKPLDSVYHRSQRPPLQRRHSDQCLNGVNTSDFTQDQYRQWMDERRSIRNGLDMMTISERWLCTKTRTPLENKLLSELRCKRKAAIAASAPIPVTHSEECVTASANDMAKSDSTARQLRRHRQNILKQVKALESHLLHGKQRFITLLALHDPAGIGSTSAEELEYVIQKTKPPISEESLKLVLKSLPEVEGGRLDYRPLVKGDIVQCVKQYTHLEIVDSKPHQALPDLPEKCSQTSEVQQTFEPKCSIAQGTTTMSGDRGTLSTAYKEEEQRQFEILLEFCRESGIVLNQELLEKALLLPADHPRESCLAALRQPGLDLLSQEFTAPPREETKTVEKRDIGKRFGWAYKELRGKRKPTQIKIPKPPEQTGRSAKGADVKKATLKRVKVVPKVDCWLTFKEYQYFARDVTARPGFNYKYHGLPENNAFWPGALAEKLRLWLPSETLADKPYSLYNIFQPVTHPRIYNPHIPHVEQKRAWPENAQGYVQFGGDTRRSYAL